MKVIIVGVGDIGRDLADSLLRRGDNQLILVDADDRRCEQLASEFDALVIHGDGSVPDILKKAQVEDADALVAATGSDAVNTVTAVLARDFGVKTVIVKLNDVGLRAACLELGVSKVITPKISAAAQMLAALYGFDRMHLSFGLQEGIQIVEVPVREGQGKRLSELRLPDESIVIGILRGHQVLFPGAQTRIEKDDVLLTLVKDSHAASNLKKYMEVV